MVCSALKLYEVGELSAHGTLAGSAESRSGPFLGLLAVLTTHHHTAITFCPITASLAVCLAVARSWYCLEGTVCAHLSVCAAHERVSV